ncbi:MAG: hypothetical protein KC619_17495 [Myxococcales bacterium]|nr:hypothetical protein [Myxococcales bacterium]
MSPREDGRGRAQIDGVDLDEALHALLRATATIAPPSAELVPSFDPILAAQRIRNADTAEARAAARAKNAEELLAALDRGAAARAKGGDDG